VRHSKKHVVLRALALVLPSRKVTLEEHILLRVSASYSQIKGAKRTFWVYVSLRALALRLPSREFLYVTLEEHVLLRALALRLPKWEVLYVPPRSTFCSGR